MESKLRSILNLNPEANIAALGYFTNYPVENYFTEGNSALIFGKSDKLWAHIAGKSESELINLLSEHSAKTKYFFSVEDWMIPLILNHGEKDWVLTTNRYILDKTIEVASNMNNIKRIDKSFSSFILKNSDYKDFLTIEYIEDRLKNDISGGLIQDSKLVAWGFTHDDGAIGFLHVLDDYRKKGYGIDIVLKLIKMRRDEIKPIFCNILPENKASEYLINKIGFKFDRKVSWLKLK